MPRIYIARVPEYRAVALRGAYRYRDADSRQGYRSPDEARRICAELNRRTQRQCGVQAFRVIVGGEL